MQVKKNIIWLASYPKSGNTWVRMFISALLNKGNVDINQPIVDGIFSRKSLVESVFDLDSSCLKLSEIPLLQRKAHLYLSQNSTTTLFQKIHDAYLYLNDGLSLIPVEATKKIIYIVRNPLDICLSLANHLDYTVDKAIKILCDKKAYFGEHKNRSGPQYLQQLFTWNNHVKSWTEQKECDCEVIRYEDLQKEPVNTFSRLVKAIGLQVTQAEISNAIEVCEFSKLQSQEAKTGFKEKMQESKLFFNQGKSGRWKTELTKDQIDIIKNSNEPMMRKFGYWD